MNAMEYISGYEHLLNEIDEYVAHIRATLSLRDVANGSYATILDEINSYVADVGTSRADDNATTALTVTTEDNTLETRRCRGRNKMPIKGIRQESGRIVKSQSQHEVMLLKRRLKRSNLRRENYKNVIDMLKKENLSLKQPADLLSQADYATVKTAMEEQFDTELPPEDLLDEYSKMHIKLAYLGLTSYAKVHKAQGKKAKTLMYCYYEAQKSTLEMVGGGAGMTLLQKHFEKDAAKQFFTAEKIGALMLNQTNYRLNLAALTAFRSLVDKGRFSRTLFPSASSVQQFFTDLRAGAEDSITKVNYLQSNMVVLDDEKIIEELIRISDFRCEGYTAEQLLEDPDMENCQSLRLDCTTDGAKLTETQSLLCHAIKITDPNIIRRVAMRKAERKADNLSSDEFKNVQSSDLCVITGFCHGEDSKRNSKLLSSHFFQKFQCWSTEPYFSQSLSKYYKLEVCCVMDKKALLALCGMGGGSAFCYHFCPYCAVSQESCLYRSWFRCADCLRLDPNMEFECWHNAFLSSTRIRELQETDTTAKQRMSLQKPPSKCRIADLRAFVVERGITVDGLTTHEVASQSRPNIERSIKKWTEVNHVTPETIETVSVSVIMTQLRARYGTNEEIACAIRRMGYEMNDVGYRTLLKHTIHEANERDAARRVSLDEVVLPDVQLAMMCLLHAELRVGEKLMSQLLKVLKENSLITEAERRKRLQDLENLINDILASSDKNDPIPELENRYLFSVELNLGEEGVDRPASNNRLPVDENADMNEWIQPGDSPSETTRFSTFRLKPFHEGDAITFRISCVRQRKLMMYSDSMIDCVFRQDPDPDANAEISKPNRVQFKDLFRAYRAVMEQLRTNEDFTDTAIDDVQFNIDRFCDQYRFMFGQRPTNYIHDMQSGHMRYFLRRYRNLYRHANIGFEAMMGHIRSYYMHGTQRGGRQHSTTTAMANYLQMRAATFLGNVNGDQTTYLNTLKEIGKKKRKLNKMF